LAQSNGINYVDMRSTTAANAGFGKYRLIASVESKYGWLVNFRAMLARAVRIFLLNIALLRVLDLAAVAATNSVPAVMPSLREWKGVEGSLKLDKSATIVIDAKYGDSLATTAWTLEKDLKQIDRYDHSVLRAMAPKTGGIFLTLTETNIDIGDEGYMLDVGDAVVIRAKTDAGIFYGTQTLLQILKQDPAHSSLPKGIARDYPLYAYRCQMIDVGRRYFQVNYLEEQIREMGWYKMNTLRLHFNDWNAFRLVSDTYPGLASQPAYTKADISRLQDIAKRYHVTIVPEIDLPAHAEAITKYDPSLRFSCASMDTSRWEDGPNGGWMLDITRPEVRTWIKALLDEFIPEFDGPYFCVGCEQWELGDKQLQCPELVACMRAKGYGSPTDVLIEWMNEVNAQIKSHGKTMQIWNWWDRKQQSTIQPDKDIVINVWHESSDWFLKRGWKVVHSSEEGVDTLCQSPGNGGNSPGDYGFVASKHLYELWNMPMSTNLLGFELARWSDLAEDRSDVWFDNWAQRPLQVLAERTWGGPRSQTVEEFYARVDCIGGAPQPIQPAK
jgi:hexosaminidase